MAPFSELGGLVVDDTCRGEGLGAILLEAAEEWALQQGVKKMLVRSNLLREGARGFYLDQGYQDLKKQTVFYKSYSR